MVVVLRPPYQYDAATLGQRIAFSQFFGQHGYLPNLVDIPHNVNMHATFIASGPGIKKSNTPVPGVRAIDIAPTVAYLLGIQGTLNARGKILLNIIKGGEKLRELTVLNISDYHAQLIPLAEAAGHCHRDRGSEPDLPDQRRGVPEAMARRLPGRGHGRVDLVAGGDSFGGATPPISNFFEDRPGVDAMNLMGFDVEALGNHTFDRGEAFLRSVLIPRFNGQMLSANVVYPDNTTPPEWKKSKVFTLNGVKLGVVGFTTEATPSLLFPGKLGPFEVKPVVPAVQAEIDGSAVRRWARSSRSATRVPRPER